MKITLATISIIASLAVFAQPNFSGSWKLNAEKSEFNKVNPSVAPTKLVVEQKAGSITYQRNENPKETLAIDSKSEIEVAGTNGNTTKVSMKTTPDKKGLVETRTYIYAEGQTGPQASKTRTWTLSADKKTLTIQDHIEATNGQGYDMVLVYERQ
jgi:Tfp pilus assembly protein FimT